MPIFVSSVSTATRTGVFGYKRTPPATIRPLGTGVACIVDQMPWGPSQTLYTPSSDQDRALTFAPPGMNRLMAGWLAQIQKGWPLLKVIRVTAATATAAATAAISSSVPTQLYTITAKFVGTQGNSLVATTSAATDGNANHHNLTVTVTGASGTTSDVFQNLNTSAVGTYALPTAAQLKNARLVASVTQTASNTGAPVIGSTTLAGGADGSVLSTDYIGTLGSTDKGLALIEGDNTVNIKFFADPGNSLRAACNAGMVLHANSVANGLAVISGPAGQSAAAAQTDVGNYRSDYVVYADPWVQEYDDTSGSLQSLPPTSFIASLMAQCSPSTHINARDASILQFLSGIQGIETNRGANCTQNTLSGIVTIIPNETGGYRLESDPTSNAPVNLAQPDIATNRMGLYVVGSIATALQPFVAGPNVNLFQQYCFNAVTGFMNGLKNQQNLDPLHQPYVLDWSFDIPTMFNTPTTQALGQFTVPIDFKTDAGMQQIFVAALYGTGVTITQQSP